MSLHTINLFGMPSVEENHAKGKVDSGQQAMRQWESG